MTQKEALEILKTGANVFLTGAAGSGKTFVLNSYIDHLKSHGVEVGVTASTGIAATHMNGVTIHSWSGLGIRDALSDYDIESLLEKEYLWKRYDRTKVLVIDEVSMLHHFRLDMVDRLARAMKRSDEPFGGMQVILCGDFFQLPPVSRPGERESHFAYKSDAWRDMNLRVCYLEEQWRQEDSELLEILNSIRRNDVTEAIAEYLEPCRSRELADAEPTRLYTHNIDVDAINGRELGGIVGGEHIFAMRSRGAPALVEALKRGCLAPERLVLKKGARVMFVKNNYEAGYVNGTLGVVSGFDAAGQPEVRLSNGETIAVSEASWSVEEDGKVKAEIAQVPLRLAWAITVHKSQGMSLDAVEVDLSKSFTPGMGYVALSRVRSLGGLRLLGINAEAFRINEEVLYFDEELVRSSGTSRAWLEELGGERRRMQDEFLERSAGKPKQKKLSTDEKTLELVLEKISIREMAARRGITEETIVSHLEKLMAKNPALDLSHLKPHSSLLEKAERAFKKAGDGRLSSARSALGNTMSFLELKIARLFLKKED